MAAKKTNKELPALQALFAETWLLFKHSIGQLFALNTIWILTLFILIFVTGTYVVLRIVNVVNQTGGAMNAPLGIDGLARIYSQAPEVFIIFFVMFLLIVFIQALIGIGSMLVLENKAEAESKSVFQIIKESFKYVWPVFAFGLISFLLVLGGLAFFIIPGIIIGVLLSFAPYEIVIAKKGIKASIIGSVRMITQNFSTLLSRYILFFLLYVAVLVILPSLLKAIVGEDASSGVQFIFSIINMFVGILGNIFVFVVYQRTKEITDETRPVSLRWIIIPAVLGYIITALLVNALVMNLPKNIDKEMMKVMQEAAKESR